jgi:hypothetical protein
MSSAFILCYVVAIGDGDVTPGFPYISDTGAKPPESCIFTLLINVSAMLAFLIIFIRYKQVQEYNKQDLSRILKLNGVSAVVGVVAVLGIMVVGAFQDVNVGVVHLAGAGVGFGLGIVYEWMQALMSYKMFSNRGQLRVVVTRILIALFSTIFALMTVVAGGVAVEEVRSKYDDVTIEMMLKWNSTMPGYSAHLVSTSSEWALAISLLVFFLTFYNSFKKISLQAIIRLRLHDYTFIEGARETQYLDPGQYKGDF